MARLKNFSELSLKKDKDLPNLKIPVQGPKGNSKYTRMKIAYTDAPGTSDIKKAIKAEAVHSADKRPEKYRKPDGKIGIRMVPMDKEVVKREAIVDPNDLKGRPKKADPNPESPYGIKHPMHPANLKKKKVKSEASSPSVLKPTKPSDITKHARTLAKNSGDYERNKKKYIDKARAKVFRMYPRESLNGLMKEESVDQLDEKVSAFSKVMKKNKKLISHDHNTVYTNYKFYVIIDYDNLTDLSAMDSERIFKSIKKNKGIGYPEGDITCHFKTAKDAHQFVDDMGGPSSFRGKFGRLDVVGESVDEATWPDEMPNEDVDVDEALNMQQRMKRSRLMKRMKTRIAIGRKRASRKMANKKTLEKRSMRQARNELAKKLTRGIPKSELTFARKKEIEKRLEKPALQQRIKRLAKRKFKDVRKKEVQRKKG